jgi:hypothetical protein
VKRYIYFEKSVEILIKSVEHVEHRKFRPKVDLDNLEGMT